MFSFGLWYSSERARIVYLGDVGADVCTPSGICEGDTIQSRYIVHERALDNIDKKSDD